MSDFEELFQSTLSDLPRSKCDSYYCSTCGGQYAKVRKALRSTDEISIVEYLTSLSFYDFRNYSYMANRRLFIQHLLLSAEILSSRQVMHVLRSWESRLSASEKLSFYDFVLYYFIRHLPKSNAVYREWVGTCRRLVQEKVDYSLLESLVLVEGETLPDAIRDVAVHLAHSDDQMRRAVTNSFGYARSKELLSHI